MKEIGTEMFYLADPYNDIFYENTYNENIVYRMLYDFSSLYQSFIWWI